MSDRRALFIGSACIDVVIYIDRLPRTEEDIHPKKQVMSLGGCACNAACAARLVSDAITFAGPVGTGVFGELAERELTKRGLSVTIRSEEENGCCYCFVEDGGERTFLSVHGAEYTFKRDWMNIFDDIAFEYVYVNGLEIEEPTGKELMEYLEEFPDRKVVYCPGPRGVTLKEKNERLLALRPILHLNQKEVLAMVESLGGKAFRDHTRAAEFLFDITGESVVVTLGAEGTYVRMKEKKAVFPAEKTEVVNTIGAGDTHAGVLIGSLCEGLSLEEAIKNANRWAARAVASESSVPL